MTDQAAHRLLRLLGAGCLGYLEASAEAEPAVAGSLFPFQQQVFLEELLDSD